MAVAIPNQHQTRAPLFPHKKDDGAPVILTAVTVLQSGAAQPVNQSALINQTGKMLELHEVRFNLYSGATNMSGATLGVQLALGQIPVTNGFIPVHLFNRSIALYQSEEPQQYIAPISPAEMGYDSGCDYIWKLDTPLLIPPGAALAPTFQHRGLVPQAITARITLLCRQTNRKVPKSIVVPYVTAWSTPATNMGFLWNNSEPSTYTVDYSSTEQDLVNNTDTDVTVKRLIGRMAQYVSTPGVGGLNYTDEGFSILDAVTYTRLTTSQGHYLCRDFLLFRSLFSRITRELPCAITLPPQGYLIADIEMRNNNVSQSGTGAFVPAIGFQMISMIGERKVTL